MFLSQTKLRSKAIIVKFVIFVHKYFKLFFKK